jgi:hypothetical protein
MTQGRFVGAAVAAGVAIPAAWLIVYWVFLQGSAASMPEGFLRILSVVWPSWVLLMADPEERSIAIPAVSIAANALLYGIVGWSVWFGWKRNRLVLVAVAAVLTIGWYLLLRWLYTGV